MTDSGLKSSSIALLLTLILLISFLHSSYNKSISEYSPLTIFSITLGMFSLMKLYAIILSLTLL